MKLFKFVVMMILIFITLRTGYLALLYKVERMSQGDGSIVSFLLTLYD